MENDCVSNDFKVKTTEFDCDTVDSFSDLSFLLPDTEILKDIVDPERMQDIECLENMQIVCPEDILTFKPMKALPNQMSDGVAKINDENTMDDENNNNQTQINTQEMEDSVLSMEKDYETIFDNNTHSVNMVQGACIQVKKFGLVSIPFKFEIPPPTSGASLSDFFYKADQFPKQEKSETASNQSEGLGQFPEQKKSKITEFQSGGFGKRRSSTPCSYSSSDEIKPKRSRGRPPKPVKTVFPSEELENLSPENRKYAELRMKNNEASRRSRLMRKIKDDGLFDELAKLEKINQELKQKEAKLDKQLNKYKNVIKMLLTVKSE